MKIPILIYESHFSLSSHICLVEVYFLDFHGMFDGEVHNLAVAHVKELNDFVIGAVDNSQDIIGYG